MRKTDRLDCVSSDTSSSVGASVVGVVVLAVGSTTSVGLGHASVLQVDVVTATLEVLVTLGLSNSETSVPVVVVG